MISTTTKSNPSNSVAAVFSQHSGAENAVKELKDGGFDVKKLSIIGSDYHSEENVVGFYNTGDRMMYWGKTGAFWGGLWGLLFGSAFLLIPGLGPIIAAGPIVTWIIAARPSHLRFFNSRFTASTENFSGSNLPPIHSFMSRWSGCFGSAIAFRKSA